MAGQVFGTVEVDPFACFGGCVSRLPLVSLHPGEIVAALVADEALRRVSLGVQGIWADDLAREINGCMQRSEGRDLVRRRNRSTSGDTRPPLGSSMGAPIPGRYE